MNSTEPASQLAVHRWKIRHIKKSYSSSRFKSILCSFCYFWSSCSCSEEPWRPNRHLDNWMICTKPLILVQEHTLQGFRLNKHLAVFNIPWIKRSTATNTCRLLNLAACQSPWHEGDPTINLITSFNVNANRTIWPFCSNFTNEWPCKYAH